MSKEARAGIMMVALATLALLLSVLFLYSLRLTSEEVEATGLPSLVGALGAIAGGLAAWLFQLRLKMKLAAEEEPALAERLRGALSLLESSSKEINDIFMELSGEINRRERALGRMQASVEQLSAEEEGLRQRVTALREVPVEVADYFREITEKSLGEGERRGLRRDLTLFIAGVLVTTLVTFVVATVV